MSGTRATEHGIQNYSDMIDSIIGVTMRRLCFHAQISENEKHRVGIRKKFITNWYSHTKWVPTSFKIPKS